MPTLRIEPRFPHLRGQLPQCINYPLLFLLVEPWTGETPSAFDLAPVPGILKSDIYFVGTARTGNGQPGEGKIVTISEAEIS